MNKLIISLALVLAVFSVSAEPRTKKIIGTGWDTLRLQPDEVLANADKFADSGLDGINLSFSTRNSEGEKVENGAIFSGVEFKFEDVKKYVPVFQKIATYDGLKESLLTVWWTPRPNERLKWNDDEGWRLIANNMGVMAKLAKEGGLKGLFLDWEDYSNVGQFKRRDEDPPLEETMKLARQRGREIGGAVFKEFPNVVFFSYWWLSCVSHISGLQSQEREYALRSSVWVAFMDGMFDVMPDGVKLIEGREHYHLESYRCDFYRHSSILHGPVQGLLSPENREKYRRAISVSYGHYLDMYTNDESNPRWYYGPEGGSRLEHFRRNLEQALLAATEYVWLYGEKGLFLPYDNPRSGFIRRQQTWEEKLPGYLDVVKKTKIACCHVNKGGEVPDKTAAETKKSASTSSTGISSGKKASPVVETQGNVPKKFIAVGSSLRKTKCKDLIKHAPELARIGFDGVAVSINTTDSKGNKVGSDGIASPAKFPVQRLKPFLLDLKPLTKHEGLKESLLYVSWSPKNKLRLPWHLDKRWDFFAYNMGMMAKLAKVVGLKGLYIDVNDHNNSSQFLVTEKDKGFRYETLVREAQRRGRTVGRAIFAAYPDVVLFSSAWFSHEGDIAVTSDKTVADRLKERGTLWPAFVNGILEVMPRTAKFVDGGSSQFRDADKHQFCKAMSDLYITSHALVDEKNKENMLTLLSAASGDSLSQYENNSDEHKFWRNLTQAARVSTEYVWIDVGDAPVVGEGSETIDARVPGWKDVVFQVKDERAWIERYLKENANSLVDKVPDPTTECGISKGFYAYIEPHKRDVATIESDTTVGEGDSVSIKMTNCDMDGTLMFRVQDIRPNDVYIVQFSTKGYPVAAKAAWREGSLFRWNIPSVGLPMATENEAGWRTCSRIVRAPTYDAEKEPGYNEMYLMIDMRQSRDNDSSWVDNVHVYKIK